MALRVVVGNFPPETTAEELQAAFAEQEINVQVTLNKEGDPNKVTAIIQLPGVERVAADQIAQRIDGMEYKGRYLKAFVPLFM
jgi:hypothetical protein